MPMSRFARVWCGMVAILGVPYLQASPADEQLQAVFRKMDEASAKFKGLKADVKKLAHVDVINDDTVDTGTIAVKSPKPHDLRMRIDFLQPDKKTVVVAGSKVEIYYPKRNAVEEYDLGKNHKGQMEQFLKLGFGSSSKDLLDSYTVKYGGPEKVAGEQTTRIELIPKSKDLLATFPKFELWISDTTGISVQQKMYQPGKDYSMATYSGMQLQPNLPDSAVSLNAPKGVSREYPLK